MSDTDEGMTFEISEDFTAGEVSGGLTLGPLEMQYEELFADALDDGIITAEERAQLEKAADNMGLDRSRLWRLEQAMVAAYESRHRVKVVERYEDAAVSLAPIQVEAAGDSGRAMLIKQVERLEARIAELEAELRDARANINVEVDLSGLDVAVGDSEDVDELERRVRRDPTSVPTHRALFNAFGAQGDIDRRFCAAQALVVLGSPTAEERAVYEHHRSHGLMAPKASISATGWTDCLFHPEEEVLTGRIFGVIAPAVLIGRVTTLRRDKTLHALDPATLQDPKTATVTAVRAIAWAASILGLAVPAIYIEKERDAGYVHVPGVPPSTVLGRGVLSGRTQLELAFLIGRHLCWYRQERFVKTLFSAVSDLEDLFLAALLVGSPGLPVATDVKQRVAPIARAIEPLLEPPQLDALRGHFLRFVEDGGRTNLQRWSAGADKTACRVGLTLCNDLQTAVSLLERDEPEHAELARDLIAFAVSGRYASLRKQLGIALG